MDFIVALPGTPPDWYDSRCQVPKPADKAICIYLVKERLVAVANLYEVRNRIGSGNR